MPSSALPTELTDIIIDHLHADRNALAACTLVCSTWRGAAQHHLLATVFCSAGRDGLEQLLAQLEAQGAPSRVEDDATDKAGAGLRAVGGDGASRAVDGSEKGISASFAPCVREMWVHRARGLETTVSVATMARVLAALPNLHTLHLDYVVFGPSDDAHDAHRAHGSQVRPRYRLRWLELAMFYQADTHLVVAMLGLFAEVQRLTLLDAVMADPSDDDSPEEEQERTRCESLDVNLNGSWSLPPPVRRVLRFDELRTFEVGYLRPEAVSAVHEILGAAAGSLESLTLEPYMGHNVSPWVFMSTISWRALTRITLNLILLNVPDPLAPIISLLSYLPQTGISAVNLKLDYMIIAKLDRQITKWDGLEKQLLQFIRLRSLAIERTYSEGRQSREEFLETVRRGMPTLAARGLLTGHPSAQ